MEKLQNKIKVGFFGTSKFASDILTGLLNNQLIEICFVVTQPDKSAGRQKKNSMSCVKVTALKHNILVLQPDNIKKNAAIFLQDIKKFGLDIIIVVAYGQILPLSLLSYPTYGCLNVHGSILPHYRGAAPIQRAIMSGEQETGVCLMKMDEGLDTGPIWVCEKIKIEEIDNFETLSVKLVKVSLDLLNTYLPLIIVDSIKPVDQPKEGVSYANKIQENECLIDWHDKSLNIHNKIRALSPIPGAFSRLQIHEKEHRLKIFSSQILMNYSINNPREQYPGTICLAKHDKFVVKTQDGFINILELQLEGKKRLTTKDFLNGIRGLDGKVLGVV